MVVLLAGPLVDRIVKEPAREAYPEA
jgi:hypothetical protein